MSEAHMCGWSRRSSSLGLILGRIIAAGNRDRPTATGSGVVTEITIVVSFTALVVLFETDKLDCGSDSSG